MKKSIYCLLIVAFLMSGNIIAQSVESDHGAKQVVYFSASSILVYNSINLNYDRRIRQSNKGFFKSYYLNLEAGLFNRNSGFSGGSSSNGILSGLGLTGFTGKSNNHFELGLSVSLNIETDINNESFEENSGKEVFIIPNLDLGYRYQKEEGVIFRTGIGFPQGLYIGLGYSF